LGTFAFFHLYQGMWRYTSLVDLVKVVKAVLVSSLLIVLSLFMLNRLAGHPRSIFPVDGLLTFLAIGGIRVLIRFYFSSATPADFFPAFGRKSQDGKRLLIIGAGDAAEKVLREIRDNPEVKLIPVGLLDDEPGKQGKTIHGVPVLGTIAELNDYSGNFDEILIAIPSASGEEMRRMVALCEKSGKRFRTIPGIGELIDGKVSIKAIREVTLEDLLGREEVRLNDELLTIARTYDAPAIKRKLQEIVPEYTPQF
jgi:FlaA1/EpsC-like NDP-sugar epimerase